MNFESSHHECLLQNGSNDLQRTHGVCKRADGVFIIVDRGDKKIKVFKRELCDVTVLAGPGSSGATDEVKQVLVFRNQVQSAVKSVPAQFT